MDIPQIEKVIASDDMVLKARFVDGTVKRYDANKLFNLSPQPIYNGKPMFEPLRNNPKLFSEVYVDFFGECVAWNDEIDLDCSVIWKDGVVDEGGWTEEDDKKVHERPFDPREYPREPDLNNSEIAVFNDISVKIFPTDEPSILPNVLVSHDGDDTTYCVDIATGEIISNEHNIIPSWMVFVDEWLKQNREDVKEIWETGRLRVVPKLLCFD